MPSKIDVEKDTDSKKIETACKILQLSDEDLSVNRQLTELFISWLSEENIDNIDLFSPMQKKPHRLYWNKDHHLNSFGHSTVARIIYDFAYRSLFATLRD
ncbi:MAG: hypothetical protein ACFFCW_08850 [Candidatus Hodarchaeota archaeon]